ncbi:hypothetical protein HDU67_004719 [Dinochytrium kinnereticum]|nr:hypothetical protein HDU67_004719 [Dinochytrium kinnereticum]
MNGAFSSRYGDNSRSQYIDSVDRGRYAERAPYGERSVGDRYTERPVERSVTDRYTSRAPSPVDRSTTARTYGGRGTGDKHPIVGADRSRGERVNGEHTSSERLSGGRADKPSSGRITPERYGERGGSQAIGLRSTSQTTGVNSRSTGSSPPHGMSSSSNGSTASRMIPNINTHLAAPVEPGPPSHGDTLLELLDNNRIWADRLRRETPGLLERLATQQTPEILWIGCSDSRVPAESVVGLGPGDLFVHRNIANVVCHTDLSLLSVLQYAVDVLKVKHIIVCGHYKCGGCMAAMSSKQYGLIDNWLRNIKDVYSTNKHVLDQIEDQNEKLDMLVELNVAKSVHNICHTTVVQNAWGRGQYLSVHGWSYRLDDGHIRDLELCINNQDEVEGVYSYATAMVKAKETSYDRRSRYGK